MNECENRKWFKILGCSSILLCLPIVGYFGCYLCWLAAWIPSPKEIERREIEQTTKAIETARETGQLHLFRPWFFGSDEFYAGKQFEMIRGLAGVRYLWCQGEVRVPIPAEAVACIASMPDLEYAGFHNVHFEKKALLELRGLPKLEKLQFWGCEVDGADWEGLAELKALHSLEIYWPLPNAEAGTDNPHKMFPEDQRRSVESLCKLTQLTELVLEESFRENEKTLKQHLPDTKITFESTCYDIP